MIKFLNGQAQNATFCDFTCWEVASQRPNFEIALEAENKRTLRSKMKKLFHLLQSHYLQFGCLSGDMTRSFSLATPSGNLILNAEAEDGWCCAYMIHITGVTAMLSVALAAHLMWFMLTEWEYVAYPDNILSNKEWLNTLDAYEEAKLRACMKYHVHDM